MVTEAVGRVLSEHDTSKWRDLCPAKLLAAQTYLFEKWPIGYMPFAPVIDGELLKGYGPDLIKEGVAKGVPVMIGYTKDEEQLLSAVRSGEYTCKNLVDVKKRVSTIIIIIQPKTIMR